MGQSARDLARRHDLLSHPTQWTPKMASPRYLPAHTPTPLFSHAPGLPGPRKGHPISVFPAPLRLRGLSGNYSFSLNFGVLIWTVGMRLETVLSWKIQFLICSTPSPKAQACWPEYPSHCLLVSFASPGGLSTLVPTTPLPFNVPLGLKSLPSCKGH